MPRPRKHGGGSIWTPLSLDTNAGILFVPVGNPSGCTEGILDPKGPIAAAEQQILLNALGIMLAIVIPTILGDPRLPRPPQRRPKAVRVDQVGSDHSRKRSPRQSHARRNQKTALSV